MVVGRGEGRSWWSSSTLADHRAVVSASLAIHSLLFFFFFFFLTKTSHQASIVVCAYFCSNVENRQGMGILRLKWLWCVNCIQLQVPMATQVLFHFQNPSCFSLPLKKTKWPQIINTRKLLLQIIFIFKCSRSFKVLCSTRGTSLAHSLRWKVNTFMNTQIHNNCYSYS